MNDPRPWRAIIAALVDAAAADPTVAERGLTFAAGWTANLATPAVVVAPVRRITERPAGVRWELALQVIVPLQADDDEPLHALVDWSLAAVPAGTITGDTIYSGDERAGVSYLVATTTLTA